MTMCEGKINNPITSKKQSKYDNLGSDIHVSMRVVLANDINLLLLPLSFLQIMLIVKIVA